MWYVFQTVIVGGVAYAWLAHISDQKDVGHAIFLGVIVAFYATFILSGVLNAVRTLIRAIRSKLLGLRPALRAHEQPNKLIPVNRSGSTRPNRLVR